MYFFFSQELTSYTIYITKDRSERVSEKRENLNVNNKDRSLVIYKKVEFEMVAVNPSHIVLRIKIRGIVA